MKKSEQSASEKVIKSEEWEFYCLVGLFRIISMVEFKNNLCSAKTLTFSITVNYWPTQTNLSTAASSSSPLFPDLATVVTTFQYYTRTANITCELLISFVQKWDCHWGVKWRVFQYMFILLPPYLVTVASKHLIQSQCFQGVLILFFLIHLWFSVSYNLIHIYIANLP